MTLVAWSCCAPVPQLDAVRILADHSGALRPCRVLPLATCPQGNLEENLGTLAVASGEGELERGP